MDMLEVMNTYIEKEVRNNVKFIINKPTIFYECQLIIIMRDDK